MNAAVLDPYLPGASPLHRADARVKLVLTLALILTAALLPDGAWPCLILLLSLVLSAALVAQVRLGSLLRRSLLVLPFLLAALPVLFNLEGESLAQFTFLGQVFTISQPGLERFVTIALKAWISLLAAALFTTVTTLPQILTALRALKTPRLLVALTGLMLRYLFVMVETARQMIRAGVSRSGKDAAPRHSSGGGLAWRARVTGGMVGSLLLRSIERSERVYDAMLARGYDGESRTFPLAPPGLNAWAALASGLALLAFIGLLGWLFAG